ncbi:Fe-S-cluster-containing dehydrogenase component [Desulfonauticus submarinus]|uniref:Fe-S-cluster-containing dehydrogenase component n=1 Tax=Desulfonauticus submarinus TaxID=206665 RepID=A0A1H0GEV5_9BACT|nr:4Fe-4S dicluster domain-containing protein [Desulfonauticus submarinus]SDO05420.1 Fe-S-cluster-containing dehydrogenase component [Desulfonauticus submarinus]
MSNYFIHLNQKRCISCKACEVHCKAKNKVPPGAKLGQLVSIGPIEKQGKPAYPTIFLPCFHCENPWCVAACPTGAMRRREDGIVYVEKSLCVGCKACILACPWKVPQWDELNGQVIKCDLCQDRIDEGLDPACVSACTTRALTFVRPNQASRFARQDFAQKLLLSQSG